jgi:tellurite resistance protein TehA-like permease
MNSPKIGFLVASALFGLMTIAQLMRLAIRPEVLVAGHVMPLWPSVLAVILLGSLCVWMWDLGRRKTPMPWRSRASN